MDETTVRICLALNEMLYREGTIDERRRRLAEIALRQDLTRYLSARTIEGEVERNGSYQSAPTAE